jgi:hypothetical protein
MNPEESQTPEPINESLMEKLELNPVIEHPENSPVELVDETQTQSQITETPENSNFDLPTPQAQNLTVEPTENSSATTALESEIEASKDNPLLESAAQRLAELQRTELALKEEIANLQSSYKTLQTQVNDTQITMGKVVQEALMQLEQRKQALQISVEQLERRQERIRNEMRTTFAGASQDLAIRVQGFKDYLTGSLQNSCN